ncbi:MAG: class 1 fructose-bisphosphatase [Giesbergeria sp.]
MITPDGVAVMASEEEDDIIPIPPHHTAGKYALVYDPLDGSSNIDVNVSVGTIFAIHRRKSEGGAGTLEDCLQPGRDLVAAGYVVYGSSTMLVYSTGNGVHGFTLDPRRRRVLPVASQHCAIPAKAKYYSVNQAYARRWSPGVQAYTEWLQGGQESGLSLSLRYIGSLVADFHRNLLTGGVFYYPAGQPRRQARGSGKLRLLYEAAPLAFLAQQAGGYAQRRHAADPGDRRPRACTSACRSTLAAATWWKRPRRSLRSTTRSCFSGSFCKCARHCESPHQAATWPACDVSRETKGGRRRYPTASFCTNFSLCGNQTRNMPRNPLAA